MNAPADANPFRLVTYEEAAALMSLSVRQLKRLVADGVVPCWKPSPGVVRIPYWAIVQQISRDCGIEVQLSPFVRVESLQH